jgi:hypothetical protein
MRFTARAAGIDESEEDNYVVVALADDEDDPEQLLELAVALRWDDQDRSLGMATYSMTFDAAATVYGGVERCELTSDTLALLLSEGATRSLGVDRIVHVDLRVPPHQHAGLAAALRSIFDPGAPAGPILVLEP